MVFCCSGCLWFVVICWFMVMCLISFTCVVCDLVFFYYCDFVYLFVLCYLDLNGIG